MSLFNTFYEQYMKLYVLSENVFDTIPKDKLGMLTSIKSLPTQRPYGFWVDRHGNYMVCPNFSSHTEIVGKMVEVLMKLKKLDKNPLNHKSPYRFMADEGFMRVVTRNSGMNPIYFSTPNNEEPTHAQMQWLNAVKDWYNFSGIRQDKVDI